MSDSQRIHAPGTPDPAAGVDRDARTEELLVLGLDHYFAGDYDRAMHVWTRVLFLDRGHARARAYIERARSALAERQRQNEELLHEGVAAFDRGDVETARRLVTAAVEGGGPREEAMVVLDRLDRLSGVLPPDRLLPDARSGRRSAPAAGARPWTAGPVRRLPWLLVPVLGALVLTGIIGVDQLRTLLPARVPAAPAPTPALPDDPLPVPTLAELAVARARVLFQRGHLRESLAVLDSLPPGSGLKDEIDDLRTAIQRALLTGLDTRPAAAAGGRSAR